MKKVIITESIIPFLLLVVFCSQIYSWCITAPNIGVAYNKYSTYLHLEKQKIKASDDILFIKKRMSQILEQIEDKDREKHKFAQRLFSIIPIQIIIILITIVLYAWRIKKRAY
ncbi:hypothetical protein [Aquimarina algiphila]|uniref:hypothetical protein n=1 Tax=Aquimarina algiphila TaxID=2047982 RepID=UPI00232DDAF5|nr:hypothetical protein [Aquimarina algiphila]